MEEAGWARVVVRPQTAPTLGPHPMLSCGRMLQVMDEADRLLEQGCTDFHRRPGGHPGSCACPQTDAALQRHARPTH